MLDDLVAWLREQLDDDERRVTGSGDLGWLTYRRPDGAMAYTIPASLAPDGTWIAVGAVARDFASAVVVSRERERLAEVDADRQIIDWALAWLDREVAPWNADLVRLLALPYADRPGYREEWRP